jgi:hypothetical protein
MRQDIQKIVFKQYTVTTYTKTGVMLGDRVGDWVGSGRGLFMKIRSFD